MVQMDMTDHCCTMHHTVWPEIDFMDGGTPINIICLIERRGQTPMYRQLE